MLECPSLTTLTLAGAFRSLGPSQDSAALGVPLEALFRFGLASAAAALTELDVSGNRLGDVGTFAIARLE